MPSSASWPASWRRLRLGDAGLWLSGGTPSTTNDAYWGGDIPWISAASLKSFHISDSERRLTRAGVNNGTRLVGAGTTLFVVRGMSLKSEFRIGVTTREVAFGQDCKALVPDEGIDPLFLAYAIRAHTPRILGMVEETSHGTGRLDTERIQNIEIGVPTIPEQRQIVAAHAAVERRIGALERVLAKSGILHQASQYQIFSQCRVTVALEELIEGIDAGKSPMAEDIPASDGEWGVLKVSAVQDSKFVASENKAIRDTSLIDPRHEIHHGDLIMTRANTQDLVGLTCVADSPPPRLLLSDKTLRLIPIKNAAEPEFIQLALMTTDVRRQVQNAATGSTSTMKNISQEDIRKLRIPFIPMSNQRRMVSTLTAVGRKTNALQRRIAKLRLIQQGMTEDLLSGRVATSRF